MEEADNEVVALVAGTGTYSLGDDSQVGHLATKLTQTDNAMTATRQNFLVDASTPHGDVVITDSAVQKPGIGWVTLHVTEAIKSGVHEWCLRVENQGETSDGSGLMLGIVPKNYSRFDSFISQGCGWCLSRAGKFYGHWRRVDDNTSVSSLIFGTGDRVIFELDFDAARMTVRVGDRFVVGEISNLSSEVYPAISLHYRHQHVKFEYHKVRDRNAKQLSWIDRGIFPSAMTLLPTNGNALTTIPLDLYLYALGEENQEVAPQFEGGDELLARTSIIVRSFNAVQRFIKAGFVQLDQFLPASLSTHLLIHNQRSASKGTKFAGSCGSLLLINMLSQIAVSNQAATLEMASRTLLGSIAEQPLLAFSPSVAPEAFSVCTSAIDALRDHVKNASFTTESSTSVLELLAVLTCQSGSIGKVVEGATSLLSVGESIGENVAPPQLGPVFSNYVRRMWPRVHPRQVLDVSSMIQKAEKSERPFCNDDTYGPFVSSASHNGFVFAHGTCLVKIGTGLKGTAVKVYGTTNSPQSAFVNGSRSSLAVSPKEPHEVILVSDMLRLEGLVAVVYDQNLNVMRTLKESESNWPLNVPIKLASGGGRLLLLTQDENRSGQNSFPYQRHGPLVAHELIASETFHKSEKPPLALTTSVGTRTGNCIGLSKASSVEFGNSGDCKFPEGFVTVELWIHLLGRDEQRTIYQHGDKTTTGEIFIDTYVTDGALCIRGGCRYEIRGTKIASVQAPLPIRSHSSWHHIALVFDGRWRLYIDGEETGSTKVGASQMFIESPKGRWAVGNGVVAHVMELRVWCVAKSASELNRDAARALNGSEPGLLLLAPMSERSGCVVHDLSLNRYHGWVQGAQRHFVEAAPISSDQGDISEMQGCAWQFPRLEDCQVFCTNTSIGISYEGSLPAASQSPGWISSVFRTDDDGSPIPATHTVDFGQNFYGLISVGNDQTVANLLLHNGKIAHAQVSGSDSGATETTTEFSLASALQKETVSSTEAGLTLLGIANAVALNGDNESLHRMMDPFTAEVTAGSISSTLALLKEHYRTVQSVRARKSSNLKGVHSPYIISCLLHVLRRLLQVAAQFKIHPANLDLVVSESGTSTGSQLLAVLSGMLNDADAGLPQAVALSVASMLQDCVPLLYPSVSERAVLMKDMLRGQWSRKPSQYALLYGLVANLGNIPSVVGILKSHESSLPMEEEVLNIASLLLDDSVKLTLNSLSNTTESGRVTYKSQTMQALGTLQLLLFSRCREETNLDFKDSVEKLFDIPPPGSSPRSTFVQQYLDRLLTLSKDVLLAAGSSPCDATTVATILTDSIVEKLLLSAVSCAPLLTNEENCSSLISQMDALLDVIAQLRITPANPAEAVPSRWASNAFAQLESALVSSIAWIASSMSTMQPQSPIAATLRRFLGHSLFVGGFAPAATGEEHAKSMFLLVDEQKSPNTDPSTGRIASVCRMFAAAVLHLVKFNATVESQADQVKKFITGPQLKVLSQKLLAKKSDATTDFDTFLNECEAKCMSLLRLDTNPDHVSPPQFIRFLSQEKEKPLASNRWRMMYESWKRSTRIAKWCTLSCPCNGLPEVVTLVDDFVMDSSFTANDILSAAEEASRLASLRITGTSFISKSLEGCNPSVALQAAALFTRAPHQRMPLDNGIEGCTGALRTALRSNIYSIIERFEAPSNSEGIDIYIALLRRQWSSSDYSFLHTIDAPSTLFAQCTLFDSGSAMKSESHGERTRRLAAKEKKRTTAQEEQPKSSTLSPREKQLRNSWETLKELTIGCVTHLSTRRLNVVEARYCQLFLHQTMTVILQEVGLCVEYTQHYYHPSQDRLAEHICTICSFLAAILRCATSGALGGVPSLGSVAASLVQFISINTPTANGTVQELCIRVIGMIFEKSKPTSMDLYFDRFLADLDIPQLPCGSACSFMISWACRGGSIAEGIAPGATGRAIKLLNELMRQQPGWEDQISGALSSILSRASTIVDIQASEEQRLKVGRLLLVAALVLGGVPAEIPQIGSTMREPQNGKEGNDVVVIDMHAVSGTATIIDANLQSLTKEREVALDNLVSCPIEIPESITKLSRELAGCLRILLENWLLATNTLVGAAVCAFFLRLAAKALNEFPSVASIFAHDGIISMLNCGVAQKLVLNPLPLQYLLEISVLVLGHHMHPHNSPEMQLAPDLANLAKMEHMMQQAPAAPVPLHAGEARRARRRTGFDANKNALSSMLLLCDPSGGVNFTAPSDRPFPSGANGLTIELIVALHDKLRCGMGSGASRWDKLDAHCRLLHLQSACGNFITIDVEEQHLVIQTSGSERSTTALYRSSRDTNRKVHLVLVLEGSMLQVFKDGDMCCSCVVEAPLFHNDSPLVKVACGQLENAAASEAYVALSGLRLWGVNIQPEYIRSIAEIVMADDSLPSVALLDVAPISFRFLEGVGNTTSSDDAEYDGVLVGNIRWAPTGFPSLAPETELRVIDDVNPESSEFIFVPRKEWHAYVAALEPSAIVATGSQLLASMSAHYARQCVRNAIQLFCSPQYKLLGFQSPSFREICGPLEMAHCTANLLRYHHSGTLEEEELETLGEYTISSHLKELSVDNDANAASSTELLMGIYQQLTAEEEVYQLEMHYPSLLSSDNQLFPLLVLHGGTFSLSFDASRSMDYLYVFADRLQKVHIAKYPDSQGTWPELELSHSTWLFLKPTSNAKTSPARCTVHGRSLRPSVGERLLQKLLRTAQASVALNQNFVSSLVRTAIMNSGDRRLLLLRCLTMVFEAWRQNPSTSVFSQCPPHFLTGALSEAGFSNMRRDMAQGTVNNTPSMTYCRLVQQLTEMSTTVMRMEAAWRSTSPKGIMSEHMARLKNLYNSAMEDLEWKPSKPTVQLMQCPGMSGGVSWRRRASGSWLCTCDRSWQTVRATVGLTRGRFYFEVRVSHNSSSVCVGLVTKNFRSSDVTTSPLGCDINSWCFDGSRLCRWHGGVRNEFSNRSKWKARDVIGVYIDLEEGLLSAMHNGKLLGVAYENLTTPKSNVRQVYYPAVSFNPSGCEVNFGASPFVYDIPQGHVAVDPMNALDAYNTLMLCNSLIDAGESLASGNDLAPEVAELPHYDVPGRQGTNDVPILLSDTKAKIESLIVKAAESVCVAKGAVSISKGKYYFEVLVQGDGMIQVGWVSSKFSLEGSRGRGLGDDPSSWAVDGCRMLARHNKQQRSLGRHPWRDGDIIGCMVDCTEGTIGYLINGLPLRDLHDSSGDGTVFLRVGTSVGVSPAVSVDPNSSATILFAPEDLTYLPTNYAAIGGRKTVDQLIENIMETMTKAPNTSCSYTQCRKIANLASDVIDLTANPVISLPDIASRIAPFLDDPSTVLPQLEQLQSLTEVFNHVFPFVPGCAPSTYDGPLVQMLRNLKPVLMSSTPLRWLQRSLAMTNGPGESVKLTLNRRRAMTIGKTATTAKERLDASLFGQIALLLGEKNANVFITNKKLWSVVFAGEGADDVGGPYRESIAEMCAEMMSERLPIFVPSANQQENSGDARDRFVTPTDVHSDVALGHYSFIGRVMGGCVRSGEPLPLYFPSIVWKTMVGDPLTDEDLAQIDFSALQSLEYLCSTEEPIEDIYEGGFVVTGNNGKEVPLFKGGEDVPVTHKNVHEFVRLSKKHKLDVDGHSALAAMVSGFHRVIPQHLLRHVRWQDLETTVCGRPDFDVNDLKATVRYEELSPTDRRVQFLWQVLTEFTCHERALFMRFVSGRERHPVATLRLKLMASTITDDSDDQHLPHASTCFFWLSLPNYSSVEIMRSKLLYAITCCQDIDADFRVRDEEGDAVPRAVVRSDHEDDGEFEDYSHLL